MELFETIFARRSYRGMYAPTPVPRVGKPAEAGCRVRKLPFEELAWFNGYRK